MIPKKRKKLLILYATRQATSSLSYTYAYPRAFASSKLFDVTLCNYGANPLTRRLDRLRVSKVREPFDAVLLLHTTGEPLYEFWRKTLRQVGAPIVWFIGNEHRGLPSKMAFAEHVGISMLVTQSLSDEVRQVYHNRLGCPVLGLPVVGYSEEAYPSGPAFEEREIDIGYRVFPGPPWLGHWEREDIAQAVSSAASGIFKTDISLRSEDRLGQPAWCAFLRKCKTQLCVSAGGEFFELDDGTRLKVEALLKHNPSASREEICAVFPDRKDSVRLRVLNSRMMEAAATRTPQIMYRDTFDGPLAADRDYIPLNKDHSNIDDVLSRLKDYSFLREIAENCAQSFRDFASYDMIFSKLDNALADLV
jgi:hypothetical protein